MSSEQYNTDSETEVMEGGAYTGRFNNKDGFKKAEHFMELLEFLYENVENYPEPDKIWPVLDSMSYEERKKKIKTQTKRAKKRVQKFKPKNIPNPKKPMELFRVEFKKQCIENDTKYTKDSFDTAWRELDDEEKERFNSIYQENKAIYEKDYQAAMEKAIHDGEYTPPQPKRPLKGYMLFTSFCRKEGNTFLTRDEYESIQGKGIKECSELFSKKYSEIKENEDFIKHMKETQEQYEELYNYRINHWNLQCLEGSVRLHEREGKEAKYIKRDLQRLKEDIDFDMEEPEVDINWIYSFNKQEEPVVEKAEKAEKTKIKLKTSSKAKSKKQVKKSE